MRSEDNYLPPIITNSLLVEVLKISNGGILIIDSDLRIIYANLRTYEIFDYVTDELIGMNLNNLLPERFRETHTKYVKEFIDHPVKRLMGTGSHKNLNIVGLTRRGEEKELNINIDAVYYAEIKSRVGLAIVYEKQKV